VPLLVGHRSFLVVLFAVLALLPAVANQYTLFVGNLMLLYIILALGLNLLVGFAGQLAFANAAMFGIGAYGAGLLQVKLGLSYWIAAPSGALMAMGIGTLLAFPALRLSGIYLALATLAFAQATQWVLLHWEKVTFGAGGFPVPEPDFSWLGLTADHGIYYVSWIVTVTLVAFAWHAMRSRIGRAFVAMRDGEIAAQALGIDLLKYKSMAFALSGFYAGAAGALYCAVLDYVSPEGFDLFQMVLHKAMIVVGGLGSVVGSVLGAALLVYLLEVLREFKATQEIAFGALLLGFVLFQPRGLVDLLRRRVPGWGESLHAVPRSTAAPPPVDRQPAPAATAKLPNESDLEPRPGRSAARGSEGGLGHPSTPPTSSDRRPPT
jgi:branched-chain amino acid transport system permease protein